ncbi:hypothetical protein [Azospirillum agricola]|nr:hypothetical protein [Azospirillum agricola]
MIVTTSVLVATTILIESALSFLGMDAPNMAGTTSSLEARNSNQ